MKAKILIGTFLVVVGICTTSYCALKNEKGDSKVFVENVEALSERTEDGSGDGIVCYYNSKVAIGYTYYDCGKCKKVYDEKGKGTYSKCFK